MLFFGLEGAGVLVENDAEKLILQQNILSKYFIVANINNLNQFTIYISHPFYELKFCGLKLAFFEISLEVQNGKKPNFPYAIAAFNQAMFKCSMPVISIFFDCFKANHRVYYIILKVIIFFKLDYIFDYRSYCYLSNGEKVKMKVSKSIRKVIRYLLKNC